MMQIESGFRPQLRCSMIKMLLIVAVCAPCSVFASVQRSQSAQTTPAKSDPLFSRAPARMTPAFKHDHGGVGDRLLPETMGAGLAVLDFDQDGWVDVYFVQSGTLLSAGEPSPIGALYRNLDGTGFEKVAQVSALRGPGYGQGVVAADYNLDGLEDLLVLTLGPNVLLENQGDGTFRDVSLDSGLSGSEWSSAAVWLDADGDRDPDLYVVNYLDYDPRERVVCRNEAAGVTVYCHPDTYSPAADVFYLNQGDGTFRQASERFAVPRAGKGLGAVAGDFSGDGRVDVYVTNDSTPNFLFLNTEGEEFVEDGLFLGVSHNAAGRTEAGMGVAMGDVDLDGRPDLVVTNLSLETNTLYTAQSSSGTLTFQDRTQRSGIAGPSLPVLGFGVDLVDLDLDGELDLVVGNGDVIDNVHLVNDNLTHAQPGQVFLGQAQAQFSPLAPASTGSLAEPAVVRGLVTLDLRNLGVRDVMTSINHGSAQVHLNRWGSASPSLYRSSLTLLLRDHDANLGASVSVSQENRPTQWRWLGRGSSYQSSVDSRVHFGTAADSAVSVTIDSPCRRLRLRGLDVDGRHWVFNPLCARSTKRDRVRASTPPE